MDTASRVPRRFISCCAKRSSAPSPIVNWQICACFTAYSHAAFTPSRVAFKIASRVPMRGTPAGSPANMVCTQRCMAYVALSLYSASSVSKSWRCSCKKPSSGNRPFSSHSGVNRMLSSISESACCTSSPPNAYGFAMPAAASVKIWLSPTRVTPGCTEAPYSSARRLPNCV